MPSTAQNIAVALGLLVPGFVWMKVFYFFGLRTRKTDPQWFLWSILLGAPIAAIRSALQLPADSIAGLAVASAIAVIGGAASVWCWRRIAELWPTLRVMTTVGAWDSVFGAPGSLWVQARMTDGVTYIGSARYVGQRTDTDDPDLYLRDVQIVGTSPDRMADVEGVLLLRSRIDSILVFPGGKELPGPPWAEKLRHGWESATGRLRVGPRAV